MSILSSKFVAFLSYNDDPSQDTSGKYILSFQVPLFVCYYWVSVSFFKIIIYIYDFYFMTSCILFFLLNVHFIAADEK